MSATNEMTKETRKIVKRITDTLEEAGAAISKAQLFDKEVDKEKKLSGS